MSKVTVAVIAPALGDDLQWISDVDPRVEVINASAMARGADGREQLLRDAEVVLVGFPVPGRIAAHAPGLRWAHQTQAGVSNLHGTDLWDSGVTLTSTRGSVSSTGIAEFVMAGVYYFARGLAEATRQKAAGEFGRHGYDLRSVTGATMGVVGLGGIGREVARLARAAGMTVLATRRSAEEAKPDADGVHLLLPAADLVKLAGDSDYVAVCAQLTSETRHLLDARVFAAMKPGAVLINVARGELVDEDALVAALTGGRARPAPTQRPALEGLQKTSAGLARLLATACPSALPGTPVERLDAADKRLNTMLYAVVTLRAPLDGFYASLSDEQKQQMSGARR